MKKYFTCMLILLCAAMFLPSGLWAEDTGEQAGDTVTQGAEGMPQTGEVAPPAKEDVLSKADGLLEKGGLENCKQGLDICEEAVKKEPNSYRANWMAAKACREYGNEVKKSEVKGWEESCKEYGKKGMAYADKAIQMDPKKVEGHYWYGMNVGIYSDGVSILRALKEGLKDKTQTSFETTYKMDKLYDKGGPMVALGRFWQVLPWPLNDKDKSMEYYREFQKSKFAKDPNSAEFNVYFAELLMENKKTKDEAKTLLEEVPKLSDDKYWNKKAKELLAKF